MGILSVFFLEPAACLVLGGEPSTSSEPPSGRWSQLEPASAFSTSPVYRAAA